MKTIIALLLVVDVSCFDLYAQSKSKSQYNKAIMVSRQAVRLMAEEARVPGIGVAVAIDGRLVWKEGFGFADLEKQVEVGKETRFGIGSISKALTTALFARLVEQGLADWDTPIETYLPEFPHKNRKISVRRIAGHTSGLGDKFDDSNFYSSKYYATTGEALKEIMNEPLISQPGERPFYTTAPYTIIAGVVEKQTEQNFHSAMMKYVLKPLGLKSIAPNIRQAIIPNRTAFYVLNENGETQNAPFFDPSYKVAGAGYLSSAEDVAMFGVAMMKPGFLRRGSLNEIFRRMETTEGTSQFGLGWRIRNDRKGRRTIFQPGGGVGISCAIWLYPDENIVIAILTNQTDAPVTGQVFDVISDSFINTRKKHVEKGTKAAEFFKSKN